MPHLVLVHEFADRGRSRGAGPACRSAARRRAQGARHPL